MPSPEPTKKKSVGMTPEEREAFFNRIAVGVAKREAIVDSWFVAAGVPIPPKKSDEQLRAEDAALFRSEPPFLGLGAPIPSWWLVSEAQNNNKSLRDKFFPSKGLHASKARNKEEKEASAKRGLNVESSDDEEGRSGLGRAKKMKMSSKRAEPVANISDSDAEGVSVEPVQKSTTNKKPKSKGGKDKMIDDPAQPSSVAEGASTVQSLDDVLQSTLTDSEENTKRKRAKEGLRRAKEERRRSRQEPLDPVVLGVQPEKKANQGTEERLILHQGYVDYIHVDDKLEDTRAEQKKLKAQSEKLEREHTQEPTTEQVDNAQTTEKISTMQMSSDLKHRRESGDDVGSNKPESPESAERDGQVTHLQSTLSKEQKKREKKQKKRERKRLLQAANNAA